MQIITFHTISILLPHAGNTQALITFYQLALNFSINSSISFPGYLFPQTPQAVSKLREKNEILITKIKILKMTPLYF